MSCKQVEILFLISCVPTRYIEVKLLSLSSNKSWNVVWCDDGTSLWVDTWTSALMEEYILAGTAVMTLVFETPRDPNRWSR